MDRKEIDILSQVLDVLLNGQEIDGNHLNQLEERLLSIANTQEAQVQEDKAFPDRQVPTTNAFDSITYGGSGHEDPFLASNSNQQAASFNSASNQDPFASAKPEKDTSSERLNAQVSNQKAMETEIELLREEVKALKEKATHFELLHQRKAEEAGSVQQMAEMTIHYMMADIEQARQYGVKLDHMSRSIKALSNGFSPQMLNNWFPGSFCWQSKEQKSQSPFYQYCIEYYTVRYVMVFKLPFEASVQAMLALMLRLILGGKVEAQRYISPALIYEAYEKAVKDMAHCLSIETQLQTQGIVMAFDQETHEVAISGNKLTCYQQEGNIVTAMQLEQQSSRKMRHFMIKDGMKMIVPLTNNCPEGFKIYLQEALNLSPDMQQEKLEEWKGRETDFPETFALLQVKMG